MFILKLDFPFLFDELVNKTHTLIYKIKNSYYLNFELEKLCSTLPKENKHLKLLDYVCTKWNSKYYMLKRLLILKETINQLINQEIDIIEELGVLHILESE